MSTGSTPKPDERMVDAVLLFRFAAPIRRKESLWSAKGAELSEDYEIPCFSQLDEKKSFAELRGAWSEKGLAFSLRVTGKKEAVWRNEKIPTNGDGLQIWLDTRDTHNIHRATRYCHRFGFLPLGGGTQHMEPLATQLPINRARESAKPIERGVLQIFGKRIETGYQLDVFLPGTALTGFDPAEHPKLGFHYLVSDRELGEQTFAVSTAFPSDDDPSLWGTLELVK